MQGLLLIHHKPFFDS